MQITKLKIFGFKSFAQRTEVNFPTKGLTAVVGPNGCGKSNITDAIRWVLGEQKAAALRMGKMQDVIFSGTEERAAMSLAEVSIVIDNSDGTLNSEYSEVIVTRRVHRDGSGEYLINNQECRLRDVHALLFDSGLGSSTYSQMNADMIKAVLSDKADDRRILFEEAAGVSKYKQQRKETRRQLERVQTDMERVEDNLRSVRRSVRLYETQAEKVNEYKRLNKRLRELDLSVSIDKFEDMGEGIATLQTTTKRMNHEVETAKTRATELQTKIEEKKLLISEDENAYRDLEREVQKATIELNDLNNSLGRLRDSIATLEMANEKAQQEINQNGEKVGELTRERSRLEEENAVLGSDSDMDEMNELLSREREVLQVMRDKLDDLRGRSRELSNDRLQATNQANALRARFERMDAESTILLGNLEKWNAEMAAIQAQKDQAVSVLEQIQGDVEQFRQDVERLSEQKMTREERLEESKTDLQELQRKLLGLKNEETRLQSRIDVLQSVASEGTDASRFLKENKAELISGILSEHIEARPEYASYVEAALGDLMDAVVVNNGSDALNIVESMKGYNVGKAVLALAQEASPKYAGHVEGPGVVGCLADFVTADSEISEWMSSLLSRYFVVDSMQTAIDMARNFRDQDLCFVAPDAIVRTSGLVSSGAATSGALSRKNEIAEASKLLEDVQAQVVELEESIARSQELVQENTSMLESIVEDLREKQDAIRGNDATISIHKNNVEGCNRRLNQLQEEVQRAQEKIQNAETSKNSDVELQEAEAQVQRFEDEYARVNDELQEQDTLFREKENDVRELERTAQDKNARLSQNENRLRSIAEQIGLLESSIESRQSEIQKNSDTILKNQQDCDSVADQAQSKDSILREVEQQRDLAREKYELVSGDLEEWRSEVNILRDEMIEKMKELNDVGRREEALQANLDRLVERVTNEYSVDLSNPEGVERVEYSQPEADREIRELRGKIKELGPINVNVMEDYEDEKKRLEEVEKQFDDLDRARASLDRT
ncbi:MAG: chromosome segregation protein SMC, partial [Fibrobacter sp.]|nr:chromosome segregation protein SMC [Fibrobacter sp.]